MRINSKLTMEKYKEYKDSGVQWLGEIPSHWKCIPIRRIAQVNPLKNKQLNEDDIVGYAPMDRIRCDKMNPTIITVSKLTSGLTYCETGDIVLAKVTPCFENGNVAIVPTVQNGCCFGSSELFVFRAKSIVNVRFLFYTFLNKGFVDAGASTMRGTGGLKRVTTEFANNAPIPLPFKAEQHSIVSYLDTKCSLLDTLLSNKEKQISLLQEMKQRVIADAVTRGINPNVKFKTTNIPWLPEIPEHWEMSKVSSHFRQRNVKVSDKEYPALSVSKIGVTPQLDNVALSNAEGNSRKLVKIGDYAVNSRSDRKGSCGVSQYEGSVSLITIVLEPFDIDRGYVHYLFRSNPWIEEFYRNGRGIVADLWTTNYQMMKGMYLPVPPLSEQHSIVSYITERASKIDLLIEKLNKEIESIKEYKQRLISDVVTGQVKVC